MSDAPTDAELDTIGRDVALRLRWLVLTDDAIGGYLTPGAICIETANIEREYGITTGHPFCDHPYSEKWVGRGEQ